MYICRSMWVTLCSLEEERPRPVAEQQGKFSCLKRNKLTAEGLAVKPGQLVCH